MSTTSKRDGSSSGSLITEIAALQLSLETIEQYTACIPDLLKSVGQLEERVGNVKEQVHLLDNKVDKQIEVGHICIQQPTLEKLEECACSLADKLVLNSQEDIRTKDKLDSVENDIKEIVESRKSRFSTGMGILVSILFFLASSTGGVIWFASSLHAQVEINTAKIEEVEKQVKTSPERTLSETTTKTSLVPKERIIR